MIRVSSLTVCLLFVIFTAQSQETFWHHTNGPSVGQDVRSFASNSQGVLFAGTWTAGEVFKTSDNGDTWTKCGAIPNTNPVLGLAIDQNDHIFASVYLRGVARSTDNGTSWQMVNTGLTNSAARGILVDKQNNVWVATEGGLFRSTNDGVSWTNMKSIVTGAVLQDSVGAILTEQADGSGNATLYRSTDGGATWSSSQLTGFGWFGIHADGSYWGGTVDYSIAYHSTDYGVTWTPLPTKMSMSGYTVAQAFTPRGDIFYARDGDAAGVMCSTDNGETWQLKNDGLTTTRVIPLYYHPNGYLFLGTNGAGVFRTSQPLGPPQDVSVTLPEAVTAKGTTVEIPVDVTSVSGWGICAYEFTLTFNDPDSILTFDAEPVTTGTLSGGSGWSVLVNTTIPNQVTVGAYGALPLSGRGPLVKLTAHVRGDALAGDSTTIKFTHFVFNSGNPQPGLHDGSVAIRDRVCGDADENGVVQAYDAALTLREALGPMAPPPVPLTPMGRLNADVNMDGKVQPFDAALILRQAIGLPMPESTATCFGTAGLSGSPSSLALSGSILGIERGGDRTAVQLQLAGVPANMLVYSYSFELTCALDYDGSTSLTLPTLPQSYMATVNTLSNGHFRVGIINPYGVDVRAITLTLSSPNASALDEITFSEIYMNNVPSTGVTLKNITTEIERPGARTAQPASYELVGAYPNPFNPTTRIVFRIPVSAEVRLEIYSMQGIRIKALSGERMASGQYEVLWDGTNSLGQNVATGEYICVMRSGSFVKTLRLLLLK